MTGAAPRKRLRVLVVDDELLGRERVAALLRQEADVEIVGMIDNGNDAVEAIRAERPDVVFLDYQMPGRTGFDVVREVGPANMPVTIFVTAYDQHALEAFELAALDYLVKPFDDERFEQALQRARHIVELHEVDRLRGQLLAALQGGGGSASSAGEPRGEPASTKYLERVAVESKGKIRVVPVSQIDYILAAGVYAELYVGDRRYIVRESLQTLEERLDPRVFMRIHRSAIVRLDLIDVFLRAEGGDYEVQLKNGVRLRVSRSRREALERHLGVTD
ncbi:MAG TPA: LytTR family DNA-binding domain-containing protein [Gemmatimonadaceae bacterium]|nr:LytTR family DNA-binding domain-containing protein [Gemmatimonadaceae bacterium]